MNQYSRAIAVFTHREEVGRALDQLIFSGFPLSKMFLLGKDSRSVPPAQAQRLSSVFVREFLHQAQIRRVTGSSTTLTRGIVTGGFVGSIVGLLLGLGLMVAPILGRNSTSVMTMLLSTVGIGIVTGGVLGGVVGQEINEQQKKNFAFQVDQGNFLLIITGSEAEIFHAEHILYVRGTLSQSSD